MLATVLSVIAIALSVLALGVQFGQLVVSGPVVRVAGIWIYSLSEGGIAKEEIEVTASNTGRSAITVLGVGVGFRRFRLRPSHRLSGFEFEPQGSDRLPHRLEPGASATWLIPEDFATEFFKFKNRRFFKFKNRGTKKKLVIVRLPNDKTKTSPVRDSRYFSIHPGKPIAGDANADPAGQ